MDPATRSSVVPVTLTDSSSVTREATEESRTEIATLAHGQIAKSTSESTVTPVSTKPLSYVEHTQAVDSESGVGSSSQVDPTPPATRSTSDPALQTLQRHLSSNTDGPYPDRCSRHGAPTFSGEFDHLARGTSRGRDFLPRRATLLAQEYPSLPTDLVPKTTLQPNRTVGERLQPTIDAAEHERAKYATKARRVGYALNIAIGLQVLLGSLTTGLSAVAVGKQTAVMTAILGALATLVASYLARMRGSSEPELSITRVKDLDQFLRDCRAFQLDHAYTYGTAENGLDKRVDEFRSRFEELLGNGDGQRKLSPV
ncbi:hypothetical protein F4604DRAFT_1746460 [Suillus subluteus]|nr:hypothetical protein F4604DRAFT_1746460 [Suillus subluteus]